MPRARDQGRDTIAAGRITRRRQALAPAGWLPVPPTSPVMAAAPSSLPASSRLLLLLLAWCSCFLLLLPLAIDAARLTLSLSPDATDALLKLKSGIKDTSGALDT